ncbi:unnamed protein product, partial [Phaeothamnion confervicola]
MCRPSARSSSRWIFRCCTSAASSAASASAASAWSPQCELPRLHCFFLLALSQPVVTLMPGLVLSHSRPCRKRSFPLPTFVLLDVALFPLTSLHPVSSHRSSARPTNERRYQAEMAPEKVRGMLVTLNQLFITFGILLAAALNIGFNEWSQGWRFSYGLNGFFAAALFLLMIVLPETPRWLVQNGRPEEARVVLGRTHHSYEVEATARKIEAAIAEESDIDAGKWKELWS